MKDLAYYRMMAYLLRNMKRRGMTIDDASAKHIELLENEYELIKQKKSNLPAIQRQAIKELFTTL